jgi:hypothetical protein
MGCGGVAPSHLAGQLRYRFGTSLLTRLEAARWAANLELGLVHESDSRSASARDNRNTGPVSAPTWIATSPATFPTRHRSACRGSEIFRLVVYLCMATEHSNSRPTPLRNPHAMPRCATLALPVIQLSVVRPPPLIRERARGGLPNCVRLDAVSRSPFRWPLPDSRPVQFRNRIARHVVCNEHLARDSKPQLHPGLEGWLHFECHREGRSS